MSLARILAGAVVLALLAVGGLWLRNGVYGINVVIRHGGTYWLTVNADSPRLSPSMRLALSANPPIASAGAFEWRSVADGFEVGDLLVMVGDRVVDHILLARIDPARYRLVVRNAPAGNRGLDQWMDVLGAALVVNGSYYGQYGAPDTPFLSDGHSLGPQNYDAKSGAFVASPNSTGIQNLAHRTWTEAFSGAQDAMVSYPLLLADGETHVAKPSRWLANRSFIAQDVNHKIVIGTTTDAFFSLDRLATFLKTAPLGLAVALNLDGGPVASQAIEINGYQRRSYGRWEAQVEGDKVQLLSWPFGTVAMPVVLAVFPR